MTTFFTANEGTIDRVVRIVLGLSLLAITVIGPKTYWGLLGAVPLVTGLAGTCPLYSVLGLNTCPVKNRTVTQS
ncbi:MAG TPA: DUF2892 domain-containing protein [Thermoanaerobaculia bacterium]|jgi:hypothetical protein|nr:DUF2892 domain-containing protein [Thermoanaerobaculia bacterium]